MVFSKKGVVACKGTQFQFKTQRTAWMEMDPFISDFHIIWLCEKNYEVWISLLFCSTCTFKKFNMVGPDFDPLELQSGVVLVGIIKFKEETTPEDPNTSPTYFFFWGKSDLLNVCDTYT